VRFYPSKGFGVPEHTTPLYGALMTSRFLGPKFGPKDLATGQNGITKSNKRLGESARSSATLDIRYLAPTKSPSMGKFGPVKRAALKDVVYQDKWGQPYAGA
jgi:hypothetical protein